MNNVFSKSSGVFTVNQFELVKLIVSEPLLYMSAVFFVN